MMRGVLYFDGRGVYTGLLHEGVIFLGWVPGVVSLFSFTTFVVKSETILKGSGPPYLLDSPRRPKHIYRSVLPTQTITTVKK